MFKRICCLTLLLLGGIMIGSLRGQPQEEEQKQEMLKLPDPPHELCHKDFIRFWRLTLDGHKGNWHLYNEEDHRFLNDMQVRIHNGQNVNSKIEWLAMEGKLPQ